MVIGFAILAVIIAFAGAVIWRTQMHYRRVEFIRTYSFPPGLFNKLAERRPGLARRDMALVSRGLRHFFLAYLNSGKEFVSMPSQVADDLWHEFILYTKHYDEFCRKAFGGFFHHSPAAVLSAQSKAGNAGLRRVWWHCCREENIDAVRPGRLPLLFALDAKLKIGDGFVYTPECAALKADGRSDVYCAGDFSSSSFDGGTSGFGEGAAEGGIGGSSGGGSTGGGADGGGSDGGSSDSGSSDSGGGGCGGGGCGGGGGD